MAIGVLRVGLLRVAVGVILLVGLLGVGGFRGGGGGRDKGVVARRVARLVSCCVVCAVLRGAAAPCGLLVGGVRRLLLLVRLLSVGPPLRGSSSLRGIVACGVAGVVASRVVRAVLVLGGLSRGLRLGLLWVGRSLRGRSCGRGLLLSLCGVREGGHDGGTADGGHAAGQHHRQLGQAGGVGIVAQREGDHEERHREANGAKQAEHRQVLGVHALGHLRQPQLDAQQAGADNAQRLTQQQASQDARRHRLREQQAKEERLNGGGRIGQRKQREDKQRCEGQQVVDEMVDHCWHQARLPPRRLALLRRPLSRRHCQARSHSRHTRVDTTQQKAVPHGGAADGVHPSIHLLEELGQQEEGHGHACAGDDVGNADVLGECGHHTDGAHIVDDTKRDEEGRHRRRHLAAEEAQDAERKHDVRGHGDSPARQ
mmetsp:Transcript_6464/g.16482  ORF Transcript_6464/g.16482 Transcript_6464/m.16482 type:complete len:427 (+) Transcript_6464:738-2018(+)